MRLGLSLFLIALGAILKFALTDQSQGDFNLGTVGIILMIVGIIGFIAEIAYQVASRRTKRTVQRTGPDGRVYEEQHEQFH